VRNSSPQADMIEEYPPTPGILAARGAEGFDRDPNRVYTALTMACGLGRAVHSEDSGSHQRYARSPAGADSRAASSMNSGPAHCFHCEANVHLGLGTNDASLLDVARRTLILRFVGVDGPLERDFDVSRTRGYPVPVQPNC